MIEFENVSRVYEGGITALKDVTLSISPGELGLQLLGRFLSVRVDDDAIDRADLLALRLRVIADAFSTFVPIYLINLRPHQDGFVWAFGHAHIAINTIFGNQ